MNVEKLIPATKSYLWGGRKLKEKYGKKSDEETIAESWELSFLDAGASCLQNGKTLKASVGEKELGVNALRFPFFPALVKLIDAKSDLSVQVHPSDAYALPNENSLGKTEVWYIVEAEAGAGIYLGFNRDVTKEEYERAIKENRLLELLNFFEVKAGESYFIPAGTIHAIGKGCLICEIQQNSNLTYRVYDYARKDKDGKQRELHIEKALAVTSLSKFEKREFAKDTVGLSKYFTAKTLLIKGEARVLADAGSFKAFTLVRGEGEVNGTRATRGDSFFLPAGQTATLKGEMEIVTTEIRKYYVGIDLGGTFIKGGIVNDLGEIILEEKTPTESEKGAEGVANNIAKLALSLIKKAGLTVEEIEGLGMGVPGMIDGERGEVVFSNNLGWEHFMIGERVGELTGLPVKIANDANVATLGEVKFGAGKAYKDAVMLTLGTGVGGGLVLGGKLYEGNHGAGAELGHSVIVAGGEPCTCGRKGCLEAYASATALIRDTKRAMEKDAKSKMWEIGSIDAVTGKTPFDYAATDAAAKAVVENYLEMLGTGIVNFANIFRPEVVLLGGGVCAQGENLLRPLKRILQRDLFAGEKGPQVEIKIAELGNSAGLLGAAALFFE
ncbi:MAG: ROK family protein [Clostridia bacterium]|nr:ROK family protein [Clostridia bacterium]